MIRVALVGAGFMGRMHAACYDALPNTTLVAVADVRKNQASDIAAGRDASVFDRLETLLDAVEVDMVDICLPTFLHEESVRAVVERGIHCVLEKPIALEPAAARRIAERVRGAGVKFMVAHVIRFWSEYEFLKQCVTDGRLGELMALSLTRVSPRPGWAWQDWNTDAKRSGAALVDLHIHDTDFVRYLLGEPNDVDSCGVKTSYGWDYVCTNYHYPNVAVSAEGGWNLPSGFPFRMAYRAVFADGALDYDSTRDDTLRLYRQDGSSEKPDIAHPPITSKNGGGNIAALGGYLAELDYFAECLEKDVAPDRAGADEACASLELVYLEMASAENKLRRI